MGKQYPRRRDVRDRLFDILDVLSMHLDAESEDFDTEFLTSVRDFMREGVDIETAIHSSADGYEAPVAEVSDEEMEAFIAGLRDAAMAAAGVPQEDEWDPPQDDGEEGSDYNYDY